MSYSASAHRTESEMVGAVPPASLNTIVLSLQAMKDRCIKYQKLIDQLEDENRCLKVRQRRFEVNFQRLRDENERSAEKIENLERMLQDKNEAIVGLQIRAQVSDEIRIEAENQKRLEENFSRIAQNGERESMSTDSSLQLMSADFGNGDIDDDDDDDLLSELMSAQTKMKELKNRISVQNVLFRKIGIILTQTHQDKVNGSIAMTPEVNVNPGEPTTRAPNLAVPIDPVAAAGLDEAAVVAAAIGSKICPMCESQFSNAKFSQDAFEAHVLAHFQGEEEDTLTAYDQYDFVNDASW